MKRRLAVMFPMLFMLALSTGAQTENQGYTFQQKYVPELLDDWSSNGYYSSGRRIFNMKSGLICELDGQVKTFSVRPNGTSVASIYSAFGRSRVHVGDLWKSGRTIFRSEKDRSPVALCWAVDGAELIVADADSTAYFYNGSTFERQGALRIDCVADVLSLSSDLKYLAVAKGNIIKIFDIEYQSLRVELNMPGTVKSLTYSKGNRSFDVLTDDGRYTRYDASTLVPVTEIGALGQALACDLHSEDKYLAVVTADNMVAVVNMLNPSDRVYYDAPEGGVNAVRFIEDSRNRDYLMYNTQASIVCSPLDMLTPNYTQLLHEELESMMEGWMQRMPGEALEEYNVRVSDENVAAQRRLYEEEIATRMADNLIMTSEVTLGNFNMETNTLAVNVNSMPPFYLNVPAEDVGFFMDTDNLQFSNAIYGVGKTDEFELIYLDVYNKQTGETYNFDNRERRELEYMYAEETFVPIDLVMLSNMDEIKLQEIKDNIVTQAKKKNTISNKTNISVTAGVASHLDETGNKIIDYNIGFQYDVVAAYSAREDFAPGQYHTSRSGAARSMCSIIKTAFETEFAQYIKAGKKLVVTITGMADNLPIRSRIAYDGSYGDFVDQEIGKNQGMVTVTKLSGITDNVQLALLRAAGLQDYITRNLPELQTMDVEYVYNVSLAEQVGGKYRRITVEFKFVDVF